MKQPHGLEVKLFNKDTSQRIIEYKNPYAGNNASFGGLLRSQVVAVEPGTNFGLHLTVAKDSVKFKAQGLRIIVVAPDCSGQVTARQWWVSLKGNTGRLKYKIIHGKDGYAGEGKQFVMPARVDPSTANKDWHKHETDYLTDSGCVAIYVERGYLLGLTLPCPEDPPLPIQHYNFKPMHNDNGLPYIFEIRNLTPAEASKLQVSLPSTFEYDSDNYVISDDEIDKSLAADGDAMELDEEEPVLDDEYSYSESSSSCTDNGCSSVEEEEEGEEEEEDDDDDEEVTQSVGNKNEPIWHPINTAGATRPKSKRIKAFAARVKTRGDLGAQVLHQGIGRRKETDQAGNTRLKEKEALFYHDNDGDADDEEIMPARLLAQIPDQQPQQESGDSAGHISQNTGTSKYPTTEHDGNASSKRRGEICYDDVVGEIDHELDVLRLKRRDTALKMKRIELQMSKARKGRIRQRTKNPAASQTHIEASDDDDMHDHDDKIALIDLHREDGQLNLQQIEFRRQKERLAGQKAAPSGLKGLVKGTRKRLA